MSTITTIVIAVVSSSALTGFVQFLIQRNDSKHDLMKQLVERHEKIESNIQELNEKVDILSDGQVASLRVDIIDYCTRYLNRGYITTDELDMILEMFVPYSKQGGNSTAELMVNKCKNLPIKEN